MKWLWMKENEGIGLVEGCRRLLSVWMTRLFSVDDDWLTEGNPPPTPCHECAWCRLGERGYHCYKFNFSPQFKSIDLWSLGEGSSVIAGDAEPQLKLVAMTSRLGSGPGSPDRGTSSSGIASRPIDQCPATFDRRDIELGHPDYPIPSAFSRLSHRSLFRPPIPRFATFRPVPSPSKKAASCDILPATPVLRQSSNRICNLRRLATSNPQPPISHADSQRSRTGPPPPVPWLNAPSFRQYPIIKLCPFAVSGPRGCLFSHRHCVNNHDPAVVILRDFHFF